MENRRVFTGMVSTRKRRSTWTVYPCSPSVLLYLSVNSHTGEENLYQLYKKLSILTTLVLLCHNLLDRPTHVWLQRALCKTLLYDAKRVNKHENFWSECMNNVLTLTPQSHNLFVIRTKQLAFFSPLLLTYGRNHKFIIHISTLHFTNTKRNPPTSVM